MEIEEEEVKLEATEPEKDGAVQTLGLRRRRAPEQPFPVLDQSLTLSSLQVWYPSSLNHFQSLVSLNLSHVKHKVWYQSSLNHLPSLVSLHLSHVKHKLDLSRFKQLDLSHVQHTPVRPWTKQLSDIDLSSLEILPQFVRTFFNQAHDKIHDSIAAFSSHIFNMKSVTLSDKDLRQLEKLLELASGNNQTVPEFLREEFPEFRSWNDQSLQQLIANKILMEKLLPYLASRNTQQPPPDLQANDNRVENGAPSVPSQDDSMNDNDVNQHVVYNVEAEQLLDAGESSRPREISGWTLPVTNLILEIASAVFDQMGYALIGMVLAFVALLLAAVELIHMAVKERIKRAIMSPLPLFHPRSTSTSAARKPVGTIVEYFGLAGAVWQCFYSTVEYIYTRQGKDNPIKMYLLPLIFLLCVVISKLLVDKRSIDESS